MEYHEKEIVVILNKILTVSNNRGKKQANRRPDLAKWCEDIHQGLADFHTLGVSTRVVFKSRSLSFFSNKNAFIRTKMPYSLNHFRCFD